jgi:hypothetical protein
MLFNRSQIEGEDAASKAATVGKIYFNILRLECGEPKYPVVCVKTKSRDSTEEENFETEKIGKITQYRFSFVIRGRYVPSFLTANLETADKKSILDWKIVILDQFPNVNKRIRR